MAKKTMDKDKNKDKQRSAKNLTEN